MTGAPANFTITFLCLTPLITFAISFFCRRHASARVAQLQRPAPRKPLFLSFCREIAATSLPSSFLPCLILLPFRSAALRCSIRPLSWTKRTSARLTLVARVYRGHGQSPCADRGSSCLCRRAVRHSQEDHPEAQRSQAHCTCCPLGSQSDPKLNQHRLNVFDFEWCLHCIDLNRSRARRWTPSASRPSLAALRSSRFR
jgi:hypothetical protein